MFTKTFQHRIPIQLPYDWENVISYLIRHECYGVEIVRDNKFHRFIPNSIGFGTITVSLNKNQSFLVVDFENIDTEHKPSDLPVTKALNSNGIRVPGCFDPFETAVSIILCQLVSTLQAKSKLKAIVQRFGKMIGIGDLGEVYQFPSPEVLAKAEIPELGITRVKASAIKELSAAVSDKKY